MSFFVKWEPLATYGDHITLDDFIEMCKCGGFIDSDGIGYYASKTQQSDKYAYPSDIMAGNIDRDFTHVMWFNK